MPKPPRPTPQADLGPTIYDTPLPELGGYLCCRPMLTWELITFLHADGGLDRASPRRRALLVRWTACDPTGRLIFGDDDLDGLPELGEDAFLRLYRAGCEMLALTTARVQSSVCN